MSFVQNQIGICSENIQQIYRRTPCPNHSSTCVFSCKLTAYFQITSSKEHLWRAASEYLLFSIFFGMMMSKLYFVSLILQIHLPSVCLKSLHENLFVKPWKLNAHVYVVYFNSWTKFIDKKRHEFRLYTFLRDIVWVLVKGPSPQSYPYFQDFHGSNLLNGCLLVSPNKQILSMFQWFLTIHY